MIKLFCIDGEMFSGVKWLYLIIKKNEDTTLKVENT